MTQSTTPSKSADAQTASLVTELVDALRAVRPGPGEVTTFQQAIIEEHAELKRALRGPALISPGPAISAVEPATAKPGDSICISGERLADTTLVRIGAARIGSFDKRTDTAIEFSLPSTATTGEVIVFTPLGVATSATKLVVKP